MNEQFEITMKGNTKYGSIELQTTKKAKDGAFDSFQNDKNEGNILGSSVETNKQR